MMRIKAGRFVWLLAVMCLLVGYSPSWGQTSSPPETFDVSDYRLAIQDRVKVTVYNEPTLSGEFLVNADGALAYPLIGNVPAQNKTATELQAAIKLRLADGFVRDPSVAVEILSFRPLYIYGEVNAPGQYNYTSGLTVLNAVALAKGFTYRADQRRIFIKRSDGSGKAEARVLPDAPVAPGDTIRVAERFF
ncbi:polysaccharide export protein [Phenylobacterium sp. LjRoot225]|uniref:polysaccharide biosynthesis/export family protein n=1 Tax=Phenylobacterium sp. LjRoot225 TaxID=3342285 RepID=UPI003ECCDE00